MSDYLPCVITPLLILAIAGLASLGTERPLLHAAVALLAAVVSGVLQAWAISRVRAYADERVRQAHETVEEHADARVTTMARQFTWAVEDTARLSRELRKAKAEKAMALAGSAAMHRRVGELESLLDEAVARLGALSEREAGLFGAAIEGGELEAVELLMPRSSCSSTWCGPSARATWHARSAPCSRRRCACGAMRSSPSRSPGSLRRSSLVGQPEG